LIEVLIALVITGFGLAALLKAGSTGLNSVAIAADYIQATRLAQSRLDSVGVMEPLDPGTLDGDFGPRFSWHQAVTALASRQALNAKPDAPLVALFQVQVTVSWPGGPAGPRQVSLTTCRLGHVAADRGDHG
jgi:general secretion pathway protein I